MSTAPFRLASKGEAPFPAEESSSSTIPRNSNKTTLARWLKQRLLARPKTIRILTNATAKTAQEGYKKYFEKTVWFEQKYRSGDHDFVDGPLGRTSNAEELSQEMSKKLQPKKSGPLKVIFVLSHLIILDKDKINDIVSINRVSFPVNKNEVDQTVPVCVDWRDVQTVE